MFRPLFRPSTGLRTKKSRVKACELLQLGFSRPRCVTGQARNDLVAAEQLPEERVVEIEEEVEQLSHQDQ
jgi:hypothetical protein